MSTNDDIRDKAVGHLIGVQRYANGVVRKIVALLKRVDARIIERLSQVELSELSQARAERLLAALEDIVASVHADAAGQLQIELNQFGLYEAEYQVRALEATVPVRLEYTIPSPEQIVAAVNSRPFQGVVLRDFFIGYTDSTKALVRNSVRMGYVEGRTTPQMVRDLRGTKALNYADGLLAVTKRHAETVVRTAVTHTASAAREAVFDANDDLVKGVQWVSTLDGRTSAVCRARDGQVYPVKSGPRPPAHPNCRSATVPVMKSLREMGIDVDEAQSTRFARRGMDGREMNGQIGAGVTYDAWLRKQPVVFQNEVLGAAKARLFRAGLTMDRYVDRAGHEYTLGELRRREAAAFERAGI